MRKQQDHYYRFSKYLKDRFGEKVLKIPLDLGFGCPNRDGTLSDAGCIYCDELGSGTGLGNEYPLEDQVEQQLSKLQQKGFQKFIGYFQSFTNTYCAPEILEEKLNTLLNYPEIILVYLGTRPDSFSVEHLKVIKEFSEKVTNSEFDPENLKQLSSEEIMEMLTRFKGIGRWTAELVIVTSTGKEALPADDLGARRAVSKFYFGKKLISGNKLTEFTKKWGKFRGIITYYLICAERLKANVQT